MFDTERRVPRCPECGEHMESMAQKGMFVCPADGFRAEFDVLEEPSFDPTDALDEGLDDEIEFYDDELYDEFDDLVDEEDW